MKKQLSQAEKTLKAFRLKKDKVETISILIDLLESNLGVSNNTIHNSDFLQLTIYDLASAIRNMKKHNLKIEVQRRKLFYDSITTN